MRTPRKQHVKQPLVIQKHAASLSERDKSLTTQEHCTSLNGKNFVTKK